MFMLHVYLGLFCEVACESVTIQGLGLGFGTDGHINITAYNERDHSE